MQATHTDRSLGLWLFAMAGMIFAMAVIGAITRLTESGLSIMEWAPIKGSLPPLSQAEWQRLFDLYMLTDEYKIDNPDMGLAEFKTIFWWEWIHRLWGRLIGLAYALPLAYFWLRGQVPGWSKPWLIAGLLLGGLQGAIGWFMVHSGFGDRTDVSQYRLALHLSMALALYVYVLILGMRLWEGRFPLVAAAASWLRPGVFIGFGLLAVTIVSGAFVAGLNAGMLYNEYPLMGDGLVPYEYSEQSPWIMNWFENAAAVQFNHRLLASVAAILTLVIAIWGLRTEQPGQRFWYAALGLAVICQYILGVTTLLWAVPISLGSLHQAGAITLLGVYAVLAFKLYRRY